MSTSSHRRDFLKVASAGAAALGITATSYARVVGANARISIGQIGCGSRGIDAHMKTVNQYAKQENVEYTAVCDVWSVRREMASAVCKEVYGRPARMFADYRDLLALKDVDAVMIASCDHQHTTHLAVAAKAKKDVYCEKPLSMDLESLKSACDAVRANHVVFQAGTQVRSYSTSTGCREVYRSGVLGKVARIEQCLNSSQPYWYGYLKPAEEKDVDWAEFLMDRPKRPFSADQFTGWYGYRDFSDGPIPGLGSHFIDLVHYVTGAKVPASVVASGGIFTHKDEHGFTCPDHCQCVWTYPEGFMASYSTNTGNAAGNSYKIFGDQGMIDLGDRKSPLVSAGAGKKGPLGKETPVKPVETTEHFLNWLQCIRTRKTCNASVDAGYQHAVAVIMAMKAFDTGRRQIYDAKDREIREG